ncbi:MAG: IS3 family transposase [Microthrixaceae bacterium]
MLGAARRAESPRQRDLPDELIADIDLWAPRVGRDLACCAFGVAPRTWRHHRQKRDGQLAVRPSRATGQPRRDHPAKLSLAEEVAVLEVLCSQRFVDTGVAEVYATLLDEGIYLCSESTMHRILRDRGLAGQRRQRRAQNHPKPRVVATAPNMVWVWDISRLPGPAKGTWFYLYAIWDLWSRKTIGWCIDTEETAAIAHKLINVTATREGVDRHQLIIHSDRGAQMTSGTLTELYDQLGIRRSLSRPRVSNDNPHAEAGFKTLKWRPDWPTRFATLHDAIAHCETFFAWYNHQHHHSGIGLLTPADRHAGNGPAINTARQHVLDTAYDTHPERFPNGRPHPPHQPARVWINPPAVQTA